MSDEISAIEDRIERTEQKLYTTPSWRLLRRVNLETRLRVHEDALYSARALPVIEELQVEEAARRGV